MTARPLACGFTLIEVLVALVIVAFGMGAVLTALTSSADSTLRLREKSFAEWVGFNQLATARLGSALPTIGKSDGDVEFADGRWHWQQQVENIDIPGIERITIQVRQAGADGAAKPVGDKTQWLATVVGFRGDAIGTPQGTLPPWGARGGNSAGTPAAAGTPPASGAPPPQPVNP
jgi:general secretion pathway protein I